MRKFIKENKNRIIAMNYKGVVYNISSIDEENEIVNAYLDNEVKEGLSYEFEFETLEEDTELKFYEMNVIEDKNNHCYMSFDFSDSECQHYPIIVRINKKLSVDVMKEIDKAIQMKMNEYIEKEEYWDADDILVDEVMLSFSEREKFTYEFVEMSYCVDCN